jgi:hypothetical protein
MASYFPEARAQLYVSEAGTGWENGNPPGKSRRISDQKTPLLVSEEKPGRNQALWRA